jgi:hypothetical protein
MRGAFAPALNGAALYELSASLPLCGDASLLRRHPAASPRCKKMVPKRHWRDVSAQATDPPTKTLAHAAQIPDQRQCAKLPSRGFGEQVPFGEQFHEHDQDCIIVLRRATARPPPLLKTRYMSFS